MSWARHVPACLEDSNAERRTGRIEIKRKRKRNLHAGPGKALPGHATVAHLHAKLARGPPLRCAVEEDPCRWESTEVEASRHSMTRCNLHVPAVSMITCCHSTPDHEHQDWGRRHLQDWLRKCLTRPGPATRRSCLGHCPAEGGPSGLRHCQVHHSPVPLLLSCPADVGAKCRPRPCSVALSKHAGSASIAGNGSHGWLGLLLGREGKRDSNMPAQTWAAS